MRGVALGLAAAALCFALGWMIAEGRNHTIAYFAGGDLLPADELMLRTDGPMGLARIFTAPAQAATPKPAQPF